MTDYNVKFTDTNKTPLVVGQDSEVLTGTDLVMFGRSFLEYGEQLNENLVKLLENFACPQLGASEVPDPASVNNTLTEPLEGQIWFNSTQKALYQYNGSSWDRLSSGSDYAANWGQISDGQPLPRPVSSSGYTFQYNECVWLVSPAGHAGRFDYMVCTTDVNAVVNAKYRLLGNPTMTNGVANYLIVGIKGNVNAGAASYSTIQPPGITPTPTPAATATPAPSQTLTPAASVSPTPASTLTPTPTVTESPAAGVTPTPTVTTTPTVTVSPTVTASPTPTASNAATATPTATPTSTPINSASVTPVVTATPSPTAGSTATPTATPTPTPSRTPSPSVSSVPNLVVQISDAARGGNYTDSLSLCDISEYFSTRDYGVTGCDSTNFGICGVSQCAPEPGTYIGGGEAVGPEMGITVFGGVAPYTVRFKDFTITSQTGNFAASGDCVFFGGSTGFSLPSTGTPYSLVINNSGGSVTGLAMTASCGSAIYHVDGNFTVEVTDAAGTIRTSTFPYTLKREDSPSVNIQGGPIRARHPANFPSDAVAAYILNSSGLGYKTSTSTGATEFTWLVEGVAGDYDAFVSFAMNLGYGAMAGPFDTWVRLDTDRTWSCTVNDESTTEVVLTIQIRRRSTLQVLDSATVNMHVHKGTAV